MPNRRTLDLVYASLCVLGTIVPYAFFAPFVIENGLDLPLLASRLFDDPVTAFFVLDVVLSSAALIVFVFVEGRRLAMRNLWTYVAANLLVGVSLALPLFLWMRNRRLAAPAMQ